MNAEYVDLEVESQEPFFCPVCGSVMVDPDLGFEVERCEHFLFGYVDVAGELEVFSSDFAPVARRLEAAELDEDYLLPWDEQFAQLCEAGTKIFGLTSHGMACGPVSLTVCVGVAIPKAHAARLKLQEPIANG